MKTTGETLFYTQILFQWCWKISFDVKECFIDYQKALYRVQHHKLMDILKRIGIDDKDLRIITNLYLEQTSSSEIFKQEYINRRRINNIRFADDTIIIFAGNLQD